MCGVTNRRRAHEIVVGWSVSSIPFDTSPALNAAAYSREELDALPADALPERGFYCRLCRAVIPDFVDMTAELAETVRESSMLERMKFARETTGCSLLWAQIWALHPSEGHVTKPCPECGEQLLTKLAKQCLECGADWH